MPPLLKINTTQTPILLIQKEMLWMMVAHRQVKIAIKTIHLIKTKQDNATPNPDASRCSSGTGGTSAK